jgi:hypothetical protein
LQAFVQVAEAVLPAPDGGAITWYRRSQNPAVLSIEVPEMSVPDTPEHVTAVIAPGSARNANPTMATRSAVAAIVNVPVVLVVTEKSSIVAEMSYATAIRDRVL